MSRGKGSAPARPMTMSHMTTTAKSLIFWTFCFLLQFPGGAADAQAASTNGTDAPAMSQLVGTVESGTFSGAVFDDGAGEQSFYRINAPLPDGSQIVRIHKKSIIIKRQDGSTYEMFVSGGNASAIATVPASRPEPARQLSTPPEPSTTTNPVDLRRRRGRARNLRQDD